MKRVFIVFGWGGFPAEGWFPWLKNELQKHGFSVQVLSMTFFSGGFLKKGSSKAFFFPRLFCISKYYR